MDALCPQGWQAQIVLFGANDEIASEAPDPARTRVVLDWAELQEPSVLRRVWAETVHEALQAMVADRITDETLHRIEQRALADGVTWPDS